MAFDDLTPAQELAIVRLLEELNSGNYADEFYVLRDDDYRFLIRLESYGAGEALEITNISESTINALVEEGYIRIFKGGNVTLKLKAYQQYKLLKDPLDLYSNATKLEQNQHPSIDVFISHSSKDIDVAATLIDLLRAALNIPSEKIRCTSVDGFRLPAGASTDEQLRREIYEARAFIGLLTSASLQSTYVLFELGARWGARLHLAPVLASGVDAGTLRGPLTGLNALSCDVPAQVHQLISDIASTLKTNTGSPSAYQRYVDALVEQSRLHKERLLSDEQTSKVAVSDFSDAEARSVHRISRIIGKLETNLELMRKALDFVDSLTEQDLTSSSGNLSATPDFFKEMPYPLRAFLTCEGDESKLKGYAHGLVEDISRGAAGGIGVDLTFYITIQRYHSPIIDFNPEADRVFKEVDTQLGAVCKELGLKFPGGGMGRYSGRKALTSEQWSRRDFIKAVNILNAARTVIE